MRFLIDWSRVTEIPASHRLDSCMAGVSAAIATLGFVLVVAPTIAAFFQQVPQ